VTPDDPTPEGDAPPPVVDGEREVERKARRDDDNIDAQPPGAYVDEESGPVPEPNEPA
jgi:hypothetical protein